MSTRIRTSCTKCGVVVDAPASRVLIDLPHMPDDEVPAQLLLHCPVCREASSTSLSWANAAYLLAAGAGCLITPDLSAVRPVYPELPPTSNAPLTLDDLLDLHEALEQGLPAH